MRKAPFFVVLVAGLFLIGAAMLAPAKVHRVEMASESDGVHQDDHLILGFVPYSTMRREPALRVTDDAFRALRAAGVPDLPEAHRRLPSYPVMRAFYPGGMVYVIQFDPGKKTTRQIADFYAHALPKPVQFHGPMNDRVKGLCPDGKTRLAFDAFGPSIPARLRLTVAR